ncbi:MAG: RND transporter, partial [Dechloromonas sp.]
MNLRPLPFPVGALLASLLLAGCSLAPDYRRPEADIPASYKEAPQPPAGAPWKLAQPADAVERGEWWRVFADATLDDLEQQALAANQDLKAAAARLGQARALEKTARAALFPQIGIGFGPTRQLPSPASQGLPANADTDPGTLWRGQASFAWEADLFGRLGDGARAAGFDAERNAALFRSTLLTLQADVAQAYFLIRELDAAQALYADTIKLRAASLALFQRRFDAGDIGEMELARATAELASAQAEADGVA